MDCEKCAGPPRDVKVTAEPFTEALGKVISWPGVVLSCTERHAVDADCIVLRYKLSTMIECSFPGRHEHKNGVIARTRCGLLLRIGHRCAERSVEGWSEGQRERARQAKEEIRRHRQLQREQEKIRAEAEREALVGEYVRDRPQQIRLAVEQLNSEAASRGWPRYPLAGIIASLDLTFGSFSFDQTWGTGPNAREKKLERLAWCERELARWQQAHLFRRERDGARMMRDG